MIRTFVMAVFVCLASGASAYAQYNDEIVVTGSRLERFASDTVPTVSLIRNADFVLISYDFVCDTRDRAQRRRELTRTLEGLIASARRRNDIELSTLVEYEDDYDTLYFPKPYEAVDEESFTPQYGRSDTSVQSVVVKTPVKESGDSLEAAAARIEDFVKALKLEGRTLAEQKGDTQLSIVNVERYRTQLTAEIRADAQQQSEALGASETAISGLEQVVRWERTGPLALKIYIPYKFAFKIGG